MIKVLVATLGMLAIGWLVWTTLQRQDAGEDGDGERAEERDDT